MNLGNKIEQLRKAKKLSIRKLAALAEVSKTTITEIENDIVTNPKKDTINRIAGALGVPIGLLMNDEETLKEVTNDLYKEAVFNGSLGSLDEADKKEMLKDLLVQEPEVIYEVNRDKKYIGPLTDDEMTAMSAYLKVYRDSKKGHD